MNILKDSAIYLIGELFAKSLPFLLLPYLTRQLGVAGFGELSFYQTICSLMILLLSLSQDGAITRYFYAYGRRNLPNILHAAYGYTATMTLIMLIMAWIMQSLLLAAVIVAATAQSILGTQLALRQCQKRALSYTAIQIGSGVLTSILTIVLLEITTHAPTFWRFVALFLGNATVALGAYWSARDEMNIRTLRPKRLRQGLVYVLAFGAPLLLHHASGFIKGQLDRLLIYQNYSNEQLGVYAAAWQVASVFSVLLLALNKATVPHFYHALKQGKIHAKTVRQWAMWGILIAPLPAILAKMLPETLFLWLLGAQYIGVKHYIILFLLGFGFTLPYYILVNFLFYHGQNKRIAWISLFSCGIYVLALMLCQTWGIQWIPLAMISSNLTIFPLLAFSVKNREIS